MSLPVAGIYTITELAKACGGSMTSNRMRTLLKNLDVNFVRAGTKFLVTSTEMRAKAPLVWDAILDAEKNRKLADRTVFPDT